MYYLWVWTTIGRSSRGVLNGNRIRATNSNNTIIIGGQTWTFAGVAGGFHEDYEVAGYFQ